jgi:hypothetical protein
MKTPGDETPCESRAVRGSRPRMMARRRCHSGERPRDRSEGCGMMGDPDSESPKSPDPPRSMRRKRPPGYPETRGRQDDIYTLGLYPARHAKKGLIPGNSEEMRPICGKFRACGTRNYGRRREFTDERRSGPERLIRRVARPVSDVRRSTASQPPCRSPESSREHNRLGATSRYESWMNSATSSHSTTPSSQTPIQPFGPT